MISFRESRPRAQGRRRVPRRGLALALAFLTLAGAWAMAQKPPSGNAEGWVERSTWKSGLREPSDVAILSDGTVVVSDVASGLVTDFDGEGTIRWTSPPLGAPAGVGVDPAGLWVADYEGHRVVLIDGADGSVREIRTLDAGLHPTDVARGAGGELWVSASPEDAIVVLPADGSSPRRIEQAGGKALAGPRGVVSDGADGVWVAEALAGRLVHVDGQGRLLGTVSGWGTVSGRLLKPKGLALGADMGLWVTDSDTGLVELFASDGQFRAVLAGGDTKKPFLSFVHPSGIAFGGSHLWVADAGAASVRVFERSGKAPTPPATESTVVKPSVPPPSSDRTCHQCHDGTRTSNPEIWDAGALNHPLKLPSDTVIPASIPHESASRLSCPSCHPIHGATVVQSSDVVTFGLPSSAAVQAVPIDQDTCRACHAALVDTKLSGQRTSHPVGVFSPHSKDEGDATVGCLSCHQAHGAKFRALLASDPVTGEACMACHPEESPGSSTHPVQVSLGQPSSAPLAVEGETAIPADTLTCLSCHDTHDAKAGFLLRTAGGPGESCTSCHEDQGGVVKSGGHAGVACESCHGLHRPPSLPHGDVAPGGAGPQVCLDCHTTGHDQATRISLTTTHLLGKAGSGRPECTTCHETHGPDGNLLLAGADDGSLCISCHKPEATVAGTDHDARIVSVAGRSASTCLSCHQTHGSMARYQVPTSPGMNPANGRCVACHDGRTDRSPGRTDHPKGFLFTTSGLPFEYRGPVPYSGPDGEPTTSKAVGEITCTTCHDPHRWQHDSTARPGASEGSQRNSFLRDPALVTQFCSVCHGIDGLPLYQSFHSDRYRKSAAEKTP
jgi:predicted CXXCH cytochrome family protein